MGMLGQGKAGIVKIIIVDEGDRWDNLVRLIDPTGKRPGRRAAGSTVSRIDRYRSLEISAAQAVSSQLLLNSKPLDLANPWGPEVYHASPRQA